MKQRAFFGLLLLSFILSSQAFAMFEVRGLFGGNVVAPDGFNSYLGRQSIREIYLTGVVGAEALVFPISLIGFGVRGDTQNIKVTASGQGPQEATLNVSRLSGVVKVRHHFTLAYIGLVGTLGLSHTPKIEIKNSSNVSTTYDQATTTSGSGGIEAGFNIGPFSVGGETGFQEYLIREIKTEQGVPASFDVNLGGWYLLGAVGFNF